MTKQIPSRKVLEGVPKVAFAPIYDGQFEFTPFPSCLKAFLTYLNHALQYYYLLSTSGAIEHLKEAIKVWS